jgi:hypothetical protein
MEARPSTRFSIVHAALTDIVERLSELPLTPRVRDLRIRATTFERRVRGWEVTPPSEDERSNVLRDVLDLNVEVMTVGQEGS